MATTPGTGQSLPPLTCKTWVLKVSIHCEACKRKVKKVLKSVEGVNDVDIDIKQQKVIVTCNVEAETLINKLIKSNKHAELWPETAERRERKPGKSKKREKQKEPENKIADQQKEPVKEKSTQTVEIAQSSAKKIEANLAHAPKNNANSSDNTLKIIDGNAKKSGSGSGGQAMELKSEGGKPETGSASNQPPATEEKGVGNDGEAVATGKGCAGKNKKGGKKSTVKGEPSNAGVPTSTESTNTLAGPPQANHSPPPHSGYQYPPHYYVPQPVYAVSYNTAPPSSSYTAYYHASPPPYSYAHTHPGAEAHPPPSDLEFYPRQPLDSFELFSDENPNGCFIM